jgi:predicted nucleotidyltransferase
VEKLVANYAPEKVILFGSYAYGDPRPDSDIDLLIIKETSERFIDRWVTVRRILSDPKRRFPLETLVLTPQEVSQRQAAGDQFVEEILRRGEVLYAA